MSPEPREPHEFDELIEYQSAQATRIRGFLGTLASDPKTLGAYVQNRAAVLQDELAAGRLIGEDIALLLSDDYYRIQKVMSLGANPHPWLIIWIV